MAFMYDSFGKVKWWELMTAFGTVGAALAATFIAVFTERKERSRNDCVAKIAAAELSTSIVAPIQQLEYAVGLFEDAKESLPEGRLWPLSRIAEANSVINQIDLGISPSHLKDISSLNGGISDRFAKAQGCLRGAKDRIAYYSSDTDDGIWLDNLAFYSIAARCDNAAKWLREANTACRKVSRIKYRTLAEWVPPKEHPDAYDCAWRHGARGERGGPQIEPIHLNMEYSRE